MNISLSYLVFFYYQISEFLLVGFLVGLVCVMLAIQRRLQRNHDVPEIV
jgi:hypothetical protein